jgi:hypothetical protein
MTVAVTTNSILRHWVAPAEAAVRVQSPNITLTRDVAGWRRGVLRGASVGYQVGSALTLPVDLVAGTLHGSARAEVKAAHAKLQEETGGPVAPLSRKQRFLLRLEDGLFGTAYYGAVRLGAYVGATVGTAVGLALSGTAWTLRAAGWGIARVWGFFTADKKHPRPTPPAPDPIEALHRGGKGGQQLGKNLGAFTFGFSIGLACLAVTLTSAGAKSLCVAAGAVLGGIVGLGEDAKGAWHGDGVPQPLTAAFA